jgi:hypothetical protein
VGLSSLPDGVQPGQAWVVDLEVLQHGRTPLESIHPVVRIGRPDRGTEGSFRTLPTGEWTYSVDDDFSQVHDFGSVRIGAGAGGESGPGGASASEGGMEWPAALGIAAAAALLAALGTVLLRRRLEPGPAGG